MQQETVKGEEIKEDNTPKTSKKKKDKSEKQLWKHKDVNHGEKSFASGLNIYKIIWVFILGCFIGVVFETLYVFFMDGVWMRRSGMLYGPFNQIYGLGAVLFTLILYRFRKNNAFLIFLASAIIGGVFEYVCSWVQQIAFRSVSWEYSDMPANIGGRTNLFYSFGWGLMGLIFITHLWPFLSEMIERIPNTIMFKDKRSGTMLVITGKTLTILFAVFLALNLALSGLAVFRAGMRDDGKPATNFVTEWIDEKYPDEVMAEKYPSLEFVERFKSSE